MIDFKLIFDELDGMSPNGFKFFKNYTSLELIELKEFLVENQYLLGIKIREHRESNTGNREIDMLIVKKL